MAPPFKTVEFDIMYGTGISQAGILLDTAADMDIITKAGSWYSYEGKQLGQGRENVKEILENDSDFFDKINKLVRKEANIGKSNNDLDEVEIDEERFEVVENPLDEE